MFSNIKNLRYIITVDTISVNLVGIKKILLNEENLLRGLRVVPTEGLEPPTY